MWERSRNSSRGALITNYFTGETQFQLSGKAASILLSWQGTRGMAMWGNPFGFKGCIGRAQFWATLLGIQLAGLIDPIPVQTHLWVLKNWSGETTAEYFTPIEPVTPQSWLFWALNFAFVGLLLWLMASAVAQRLNDLGVSWKWAVWCFAGFVAAMTWTIVLGRPGSSITWVDVVYLILMVPTAAVGAFGMFMMALVPSYRSRRDRMAEGDMRKIAT